MREVLAVSAKRQRSPLKARVQGRSKERFLVTTLACYATGSVYLVYLFAPKHRTSVVCANCQLSLDFVFCGSHSNSKSGTDEP